MTEKLKPCPFCGSMVDSITYKGSLTKVQIFCEKCCVEMTGPWCSDPKIAEKLAIEAWNRRAE